MTRLSRFVPAVFLLVAAGELSAAAIRKPNFTGFQAGLVGGGSIGRTEIVDPAFTALAPNSIMAATGFAAGLQLGYGTVMSGVFLGADIGVLKDWASDTCELQASMMTPDTGTAVVFPMLTYKSDVKIRRETPFYISAKLGYQIDNALPYIRVGYANSKYRMTLDSWSESLEADGTMTPTDKISYKIDDRRDSFIVSGGIDFLVTSCFVAGLNYDIIPNQSRKTFAYNGPDKLTLKHNHHQVMLKLSYRM